MRRALALTRVALRLTPAPAGSFAIVIGPDGVLMTENGEPLLTDSGDFLRAE